MHIDRAARPVVSRLFRAAILSVALLAPVVLTACTTVEGTNALVDPGTFEREVMNTTLVGVGVIGRADAKDDSVERRGPLVLPRQAAGATLPAPTNSRVAELPVDSDSVQIDASNLTAQDVANLRNARVVDPRALSGRPLTEAETRQLTARMRAANMAQLAGKTQRPLYLPPDEYFTTVGGSQMVCKASNGDLVSINDDRCPQDIRDALRKARTTPGPTSNDPDLFNDSITDMGR